MKGGSAVKKLLALILALSLVLCLAACGETPDPTEPTGTADTTQKQTKTVYVHSSITQQAGENVTRTEYIYDDQNVLTQVVQSVNDAQTNTYNVECDENGNFTKWSADVEGTQMVTEYTYDEQGRSLGTFAYMNGVLMTSTEYTWEDGRRTSITTKMPTQELEQRMVFIYDENGCMLRQDAYLNGELNGYIIYSADEQGRTAAATSYQPDGTVSLAGTYTYEGSTTTVITSRSDGTVEQKTVTVYDEQGNLSQSTVYDGDGNILSSEKHTWMAIEVPLDCPRASV